MNGAIYVAYGGNARREATASIASLWQHNEIDVAVVCNETLDVDGAEYIPLVDRSAGARWPKLNIDKLAPSAWENVLYLDADTRIRGNIMAGFGMLSDGWDMVIAPSTNQDGAVMRHIGPDEKEATFRELGNPFPLQLQAGVMFFNRARCCTLFEAWRGEWKRWKDQDQAALLRALDKAQIRIHILGKTWNGEGLIEHLFGSAR